MSLDTVRMEYIMTIDTIDTQYDKSFTISFQEYLPYHRMDKETFGIFQKKFPFEADKIREKYHMTCLKAT